LIEGIINAYKDHTCLRRFKKGLGMTETEREEREKGGNSKILNNVKTKIQVGETPVLEL